MARRDGSPFLAKLATGGVAGMTGVTVIFPIDMCKTRMQRTGVGAVSARAGVVEVGRAIVRAEGWRGLYRGLGANLAGVFPEKGIKLAANDWFRARAAAAAGAESASALPLAAQIACGACAAACQVVATTPMEMVKMQCQVAAVETGTAASPVAVAASLGPRGLYKGFFATLARETPFGAIVLPLYPFLLHAVSGGHDKPGIPTMLACGVAAGGVAAGATCPIDVVKTRVQLAASQELKPGQRPATFSSVLVDTWKIDGPRGFFRGVGPRISIFSGLYGVLFLSYEVANTVLGL